VFRLYIKKLMDYLILLVQKKFTNTISNPSVLYKDPLSLFCDAHLFTFLCITTVSRSLVSQLPSFFILLMYFLNTIKDERVFLRRVQKSLRNFINRPKTSRLRRHSILSLIHCKQRDNKEGSWVPIIFAFFKHLYSI